MTVRVTLTVTEGPHQGQVFTFAEHDTFIVGRSKHAHFRLPSKDKYFSRHHFLVEVNPPHCRVMDLGSRNGTYINGVRTPAADLRDGDLIKAGRTVLRASIEHAAVGPIVDEERILPSAIVPTVSYVPPFAAKAVPGAPRPSPDHAVCPACGGARLQGAKPMILCAGCEAAACEHPQPIAGYRLVRELGRGGMGVVALAIRLADGMPVALKTITPQSAATPADLGRFMREASILRELDHPHIVGLRDMGQAEGRLLIAMDYVRGTNAADLLGEHPSGLPIGRAVALVCQLLDALDYAHAKQFVHRDIKPANLLVAEGDLLKLADFGLARVYQSSSFSGLTMQGDYGGTYPFMPPEQITRFRESQPANDLYSVGATLYNLLTGRYIYDFPATIEGRVLMLLQEDPIPIRSRCADIPPALAAAIHRALAREPADRFASARAMKEALDPLRTT